MTNVLRSFFAPPPLTEADAAARARTLHRTIWLVAAMATVFLVGLSVLQPETTSRRMNTLLVVTAACLVLLILNRRGLTRAASWLFVGMLVAVITERAYTSGGVTTASIALFLVVLMVAGLVIGTRGAIITAVVQAALALAMVRAEITGVLPRSEVTWTPGSSLLMVCLCMAIVLIVQDGIATNQREIESRFRAMFEHSASGMALVDRQGRPVKCNPALTRMVGYSEAELSRMSFTDFTHPEDRDIDWSLYSELMAGKRAKYEIEKRYITKDGRTIWAHLTVSLVRNAAGVPEYAVGMVQDVTARKTAEAEALRASERLKLATEGERRARERALRAQLAAKLEERTRLARELHDTLLQGLTGVGLKLVAVTKRLDAPPELMAALRDVIATTQRTLEDARRAVSDIRSPAAGSSGFAAALQAAIEEGVRGSGVALECVIQDPTPVLHADVEAAVLRVAQEAIANAIQHAAAQNVYVTLACGARRVRLSVADDGRGFVVDPHLRASEGHWGLLGMRERASQIGGRLSVKSSPGDGTRVVLIAPLAGPATPPPVPAPQA